MDHNLATFAVALLLFTVASCASVFAPAKRGAQDECAAARISSLELNQIAKAGVTREPKPVSEFTSSLVWMEATDMCDPGALRKTPAPCIGKVLDALTRYRSAVESVATIETCSHFAKSVEPKLRKLHNDISRCVRASAGLNHHQVAHISQENTLPSAKSEKDQVCSYIKERLFSFSILTARIFSVGDPTNHSEGTAQTCI